MLFEKCTPVASGDRRSNKALAGTVWDRGERGVECMVPEVSVAACVETKVKQQCSRTITRVIKRARLERCPLSDNKGC